MSAGHDTVTLMTAIYAMQIGEIAHSAPLSKFSFQKHFRNLFGFGPRSIDQDLSKTVDSQQHRVINSKSISVGQDSLGSG